MHFEADVKKRVSGSSTPSSYRGGRNRNGEANKLDSMDRPAHDWYRFVLSFPPHLVRDYLKRFRIGNGQKVLDPFCGTGTTLVECQKLGIASVGIEANPMAYFASQIKVNWNLDPDRLLRHAREIAEAVWEILSQQGIQDNPGGTLVRNAPCQLRELDTATQKLLLTNSLSPLPLHKTLILLECLEKHPVKDFYGHERLALAKALVSDISNLHFGPEVGVKPAKPDAPVIAPWLARVYTMGEDIGMLQKQRYVQATVHQADARQLSQVLEPHSIDAVITSPPYPNEKDYTRATRLESVLLGLIRNKADLQTLKRRLVRSNTRGVYVSDNDDNWISQHTEIQRIAHEIEARRLALGKTSGFERLYARVTKLYFGGIAKHLADLSNVLRPGAQLAYVVGDQASYLRVMIRTGELIADISKSLGYEVVGIDLFRTRLATATKEQLREEVVILRWPGKRLSTRSPRKD